MAGSSFLLLIDDIATLLDDVAAMTKVAASKSVAMADDVSVMTKVAAQKTAGVLGDDLALNAQQVAGVTADRELPVVWAVAKGSMVNKAILVPAALAISALAPWAVTPLLMVGGAYLCFEGFEKVAYKYLHSPAEEDARRAERVRVVTDVTVDLVVFEKNKVKGAVRTDFVLSAEIIAITLGTVATSPFVTQVTVLVGIAIVMTIGVYGVVAGIVKLDDLGLYLTRRSGAGAAFQRRLGAAIVKAAPYLMRTLTVLGTAAMFLVGGGILTHGIPALHHAIEMAAAKVSGIPGIGGLFGAVTPTLLDGLSGVVAGALALAGVSLAVRLFKRPATAA